LFTGFRRPETGRGISDRHGAVLIRLA